MKKMEKKIENLSKLADDIVLSDQNERELFDSYKTKLEVQRKKKHFIKTQCRIAVAFAMLIVLLTTYFLQSPEVVVYASTGNKMVQLELNEKTYLEKQRTPLGYGYVLEINVKDGRYYYTIENKENLNAENIFRDENKIFWIPDGINSMNFRDQDGNVIKIPETDSSTLNIEVCNADKKIIERVTLILEREGEECSVELLKSN